MPRAPKVPCRHRGCPALVERAVGWCPTHLVTTSDKFANRHRGSPIDRGYPRTWESIRLRVLTEEPLCRYCQRAGSTQVDHILPLSQGGTHDRINLAGCCERCHKIKTAREANAERWQRA